MPKRTGDYRAGLLAELRDPQAAAHYLNAALEDSGEMFQTALRDVAEAHQVAALVQAGDPLTRVLNAVGLKLAVKGELSSAGGAPRGLRDGSRRKTLTRS